MFILDQVLKNGISNYNNNNKNEYKKYWWWRKWLHWRWKWKSIITIEETKNRDLNEPVIIKLVHGYSESNIRNEG